MKDDIVCQIFGNEFMDEFHDYVHPDSLWRYQHRQRAKIIRKELNKTPCAGNSFLDAGSGRASSAYMAKGNFKLIYVFDIDQEEISMAKKNLTNLSNPVFVIDCVDLKKTNLKEDSIDTIVLSEVIEHIDKPSEVLKEIRRVLKPNGRII